MLRFIPVFFAIILLTTLTGRSQIIATDSIVLASYSGTITKVIARQNAEGVIAVAWQVQESNTLYFQTFKTPGIPVSHVIQIIRPIPVTSLDFGLALDSLGHAVLAWSQNDTLQVYYNISYEAFDAEGKALSQPQSIGTGETPGVTAYVNSHGEFLISWFNEGINIQLFNNQRIQDGSVLALGNTDLSRFSVELTDRDEIAVGWIQTLDFTPSLEIMTLNKQGAHTNSTPAFSLDDSYYCCMTGEDMDYNEDKTVFSFSLLNNIIVGGSSVMNKGTYMSMISRYNEGQSQNIVSVDNIGSSLTHIRQNKQGTMWMGWNGVSGPLKAQLIQSSGQPATAPVIVFPSTSFPLVSSFDIMLTDENQGSIVYAVNGSIVLQRYQLITSKETQDIIVKATLPYTGTTQKPLEGSSTHVIVWQNIDTTQYAILAQLYDRTYTPLGAPINVTGFQSGLMEYDAAIDSTGNFMIVWKLSSSSEINAAQFAKDGSISTSAFQVNQTENAGNNRPAVSANAKGDFIVVWHQGDGDNLAGRLIGNGNDSGEIALIDCCVNTSSQAISINNARKFVYAYRDGYYDIGIMIFDSNLQLINSTDDSNVFGTNDKFNMAFSNQDQIVLAYTDDSNFESNVLVQRFDGNGSKVGALLVLSDIAETDLRPGVSIKSNGDYAVIFRKTLEAYYMQRFKSNGTADGSLYRLNTFLTEFQSDISMNFRGDVFAAFGTNAYGTQGLEIVAKGYNNDPPVQPMITYETLTINQGDSVQFGGIYLKRAGKYSTTTVGADQSISIVILTLKVNSITGLVPYAALFTVYPNPVKDKLFIHAPENETVLDVEIVSMMGFSTHVDYQAENNSASVSSLSPGFYYVKIITTAGSVGFKIIKQ